MRIEPDSDPAIPTFASLAAEAQPSPSSSVPRTDCADDPEIAALLDFEPVPRKIAVAGGWTPEAQRDFIARLAVHGSANKACEELGKNRTGITKLYRSPQGASFRAAWEGAVALATRRRAQQAAADFVDPGATAPTLDHRRKAKFLSSCAAPLPGQMRNEHGEWEDQDSLQRRAEDARDSIAAKLLNARRLYLMEISDCAGKRAAFEILTQFPIDWDKAGRMEPQADEPWRTPNLRQPDMLLTAENGWVGGIGYGPDKMAELRKVLDQYRAEQGLEPVDWEQE